MARILVACEESGVVREAFRKRGHYAVSCDLLPSRIAGPHIQCDVRALLYGWDWDLMIAFPPCTYLAASGLHWNKRIPGRAELTRQSILFVQELLDADIPRIAIENPVGAISSEIRKPDQIFHPYQFGHNASKKTCLWLKGLPPLKPTQYVWGRKVNGRRRWANQLDSGQNIYLPGSHRARVRASTYPKVADAMAEQWGCLEVLR